MFTEWVLHGRAVISNAPLHSLKGFLGGIHTVAQILGLDSVSLDLQFKAAVQLSHLCLRQGGGNHHVGEQRFGSGRSQLLIQVVDIHQIVAVLHDLIAGPNGLVVTEEDGVQLVALAQDLQPCLSVADFYKSG